MRCCACVLVTGQREFRHHHLSPDQSGCGGGLLLPQGGDGSLYAVPVLSDQQIIATRSMHRPQL